MTFDGPVDITNNQTIDGLFLAPAGVETIKSIHMFEGEDGKVRTVIGMRGDACAKMSAPNFKKKNARARRIGKIRIMMMARQQGMANRADA